MTSTTTGRSRAGGKAPAVETPAAIAGKTTAEPHRPPSAEPGHVPRWWSGACLALRESDPRLGALIDRHPPLRAGVRGDAFATLARSIVGQQVSVKAAQSVWERLAHACGTPSPESVAALPAETLRGCGLSGRKTEYLGGLAAHFLARGAHGQAWARMDDAAIVAELTCVRGIGLWTVQMFLIFHLARPDVWPLADLGLRRAIALRYGRGRDPAQRTLDRLSARWQPWRTAATWYLWRSLEPEPVPH